MANPSRGSVALQAGDKAYTVSFSLNALCDLEDVFGMKPSQIGKLFDDEENVSPKDIRKLIMVALRDHHGKDVNEEMAGDVATAAGITTAMDAVGKAFALTFPEAEEGKANPRKAKSSTR